ncbi:hypothetical protein ASPWEDRAFT_40175 [Aspergillus wentii DTO 134E9]|uniref:Uncharacterized protein n=1 Tax=Aspergillus wentii DTO 134E9 TaxID=1073089 RepID=A0A1L9RJG6_ASPWE|nr:uncharacterized protein ASPWEDRAFT_40175 [Aspergillus wentii DTO 134E9]OJJ35044.1 hypothetical protein ASPWEDRAFT_40175 [Aspergillus wentii DTO 134E9]
MMPRTEPKRRSWAREYTEAEDKLLGIWGYFNSQMKKMEYWKRTQYTPTDEELRNLGIELSDLDFETGETSSTIFPYFMPSQDKTVSVSNSGIHPDNDAFNTFNRSNTRRIFGEYDWYEYLHLAFGGYVGAIRERQQPEFDQRWELPIPQDRRSTGSCAVRETMIYGKMQARRPSQSHRVVKVLVDKDIDENRPSVSEWIGLVSWMLGGMRYQLEQIKAQIPKKPSKDQRRELNKRRLHIVFPTLVLCFMKPARVRVLYGYFEYGILKVQFSKCQDFNVPNYVERMDCLLRWIFPTTNGDTRLVGLQAISEDEEDEEAESYEKKHGIISQAENTVGSCQSTES